MQEEEKEKGVFRLRIAFLFQSPLIPMTRKDWIYIQNLPFGLLPKS